MYQNNIGDSIPVILNQVQLGGYDLPNGKADLENIEDAMVALLQYTKVIVGTELPLTARTYVHVAIVSWLTAPIRVDEHVFETDGFHKERRKLVIWALHDAVEKAPKENSEVVEAIELLERVQQEYLSYFDTLNSEE